MNLKDNTKRLKDLREQIGKLDEEYEAKANPLKAERDTLQADLMAQLKADGQFSVRFDFATLTLSVRKTPKVVDEGAVIAALKKLKLAKEYVEPRLKDSFYTTLPTLVKEGRTIQGVEVTEKEYLSLRGSEEGDKRKAKIEGEQCAECGGWLPLHANGCTKGQ